MVKCLLVFVWVCLWYDFHFSIPHSIAYCSLSITFAAAEWTNFFFWFRAHFLISTFSSDSMSSEWFDSDVWIVNTTFNWTIFKRNCNLPPARKEGIVCGYFLNHPHLVPNDYFLSLSLPLKIESFAPKQLSTVPFDSVFAGWRKKILFKPKSFPLHLMLNLFILFCRL